MTVSAFIEADIARLHYVEHFPIGTISTQLGIHVDVVKRVLGIGPAPKEPRQPLVPMLAPYSDFIASTLEKYPRLRSTRLYDMLRARNFQGSPRTVRRYVQQVRPKPAAEVFLRTQVLPGEQAQVDWGCVGKIAVPGGTRTLWVFVLVLSYSRALWAELVFDLSVYSLRRSLIRAADYFGGCPRSWLFDNPKTVVLQRHGAEAQFHPLLLELCGALRVQPRLCKVRAPWQKGRVERSMRYLWDRFFAGRTIPNLEVGNQQLLEFIQTIPPERPHPDFPKRTVADLFAEEKPLLLCPPQPLPCTDQVQPIQVDKTAFVRFDRNHYSVPPACARKALTLCASDSQLRFLDGGTEVSAFPRSYGVDQVFEKPEHREELLRLKQQARAPKARDRLQQAIPAAEQLYGRWLLAGRNIGSLTFRTLKLLDLYGQDILTVAVTEALARDTCDLGSLSLLCETQRKDRNRPVPVALPLGDHVPEHDVIPHNLESYDVR